ncbi:hypothetical protein SEUCBS139899_007684 [Sporothrix eucalyptigena]|uniref:Uncharacterized protein n=1 Tax=Sporothrix eucalyptigena TaxID=1812306 RepID=A0ABP0CEG9_9PEZI
MRLVSALAIAAAPGGVAAFAVPLLRAHGRISIYAPSVPDYRRPAGTGASIEGLDRHDIVRIIVVGTTTRTEFETVLTTSTITPTTFASATESGPVIASTTPPPATPTISRSCDLRYCDAGTSYCEYWGGYSSFDVSAGRPIPGETRTSIGICTGVTPIIGSHTGKISFFSESGSSTASSNFTGSTTTSQTTASSDRDPLDTITCTSTTQSVA